jgi:diaminopimelate decarboxylase
MAQLPPGIVLGADVEIEEAVVRGGAAAAAVEADQEADQEAKEEVDADAAEVDMGARVTLERELNRLIPEDTSELSTPRFVLSRETVREQLEGHKVAVERALAEIENAPALKMCLSVKTQPHPAVLAEAKAAGYLGEVITSTEMHACLDAGWAPNEIVMNGPGKWYGDMSGPRSTDPKPTSALRCLFADSLADLKTIVERIADPADWLDAEIVGVRFSPVAVTGSRFGMNCKDPKVLLAAAELVGQLPARVKVGLHMHFAASTLGVEQWFGVASGYLRVAASFVQLIEQDLSVLDFGGGWPSHLLDHADVHPHLVKLLRSACTTFPTLECVQFEPGKSITERAGAVLTKVIAVREMERKLPDAAPSNDASSSSSSSSGDDGEASDDDDDGEACKGSQNYAAVVDACISDMGSFPLHVHPLLWQHGSGTNTWSALETGKDQMWGSICMEFDVLGASFKLPEKAAVGDHVLIAFTGAYDTSMAYDFADGKARDMLVL